MFRFAGYVAVQIAGLLALAACTSDPTVAADGGGAGAGGSVANVAGSQSIAAAGVASPSSAGVGGAAAPAAPSGGAGASGARSMAGSVAAGQGGGSAGTAAAGAPAAGAPAAGGGGTGGAVAEPSGFRCPNGPFGAPLPASVSVARVDGLPPADAFNDSGRTRTNIEGAVWIRDTLYVAEFPFTPAPGSRVLALGPDNQVSVALASAGANGMAVDAMGNLILTDHGRGAIVRMSFPLGTPQVLIGTFNGARFNSPNDLAVRSDGNIYFSDPDYQAPSQRPQQQTRVYRLAPGASEVTVVDATRSQPNGVTLSSDERTLYVAGNDGILSYALSPDGSVMSGPGKRLNGFNGSADGLGMDCAGNLYAASGKRVAVVSPAGMEIGSISVDQAESVTNVAFGGPDHKTLFITAMGSGNQRGVFKATLNVPGFPY